LHASCPEEQQPACHVVTHQITDRARCASYLGRVPDNLRARELADALGVPGFPSSGS